MAKSITEEIGTAAGVIWKHLEKNGEVTMSSLVKSTKLNQRMADRAIGWLAREGKIYLTKNRNREMISLIRE